MLALRSWQGALNCEVSIDGLIAATQNLGKVGDAVIESAGKVRKILMGGLLE